MKESLKVKTRNNAGKSFAIIAAIRKLIKSDESLKPYLTKSELSEILAQLNREKREIK